MPGDPIKNNKLKASHILVKKLGQATKVLEEIKKGGDFGKLALQYSECPSKKQGGSLGEFARGKMVKEFWDGTANLKIGEISPPVKTQFGYHIIKRTG